MGSAQTENRKFGFFVGGILTLIGGGLLYRHRATGGVVCLAVGLVLLLLAATWPSTLATPHRLWLAFGRALGKVNSVVFLALVYFVVLTPLGLLFRLAGRDELRRRRVAKDTMWMPYSGRGNDPAHFEKMF